MRKMYIGVGIMAVCLMLFGCVTDGSSNTSGSGAIQAPPPVVPTHTTEQQNLEARLALANNPSATMWIYGLSDTGTLIFKSAVKGKVTSSSKRLEPVEGSGYSPITTNNCQSRSSNGQCSNELIQADGTFGSSDMYVFWFDYEGNYFQWDGKYILSSKPLNIPQPSIEFQTANETG